MGVEPAALTWLFYAHILSQILSHFICLLWESGGGGGEDRGREGWDLCERSIGCSFHFNGMFSWAWPFPSEMGG